MPLIQATFYMEIKPDDMPDDRGSIGHWLCNFMEDAIKNSESTDETFEKLDMSWEFAEGY